MKRVALALLCLVSVVLAQEDEKPGSPRALFEAFYQRMDRYAQGDEKGLAAAAKLFDVSDLKTDADTISRQAAKDLLDFLDRYRRVKVSRLAGRSPYVHETPYGNITCIRGQDGTWLFSKETRKGAADLYAQVADKEVIEGGRGVRDTSTWLRNWMPGWMLHRVFVLQNWQWAGLLVLLLVGLVLGTIGRVFLDGFAQRLARRRGVELAKSRRKGRPFVLTIAAVVFAIGLPFLLLPEGPFTILMLATRFVLMVGGVWSLCRIVDWSGEVLAGVALRTDNRLDDLLVPMVRKAIKVFVVALGIVYIADNLGMDIAALLAGLGIGGVAIALASKDTVENFFGAISILSDRPFQVGDWIKMNDIEGTVEEVGFRSTRVRTFYDSLITFPNAMLIRSAVDNLGERTYRRLKATIGVTYDTPADKLESFLEGIRELIRRHPYTRKDYYHVYFHSYGDNALNILLYLFLKAPDWATELRERQRMLLDIKRLAEKLGVEFAFPTRTVHVVQGEVSSHAPGVLDGRREARGIVDEFTGDKIPPPVDIADRPDDAAGDG